MAEAKRLWEVEAILSDEEAKVSSITTIQAGVVLDVLHGMCSLDEIGKAYTIGAVRLADIIDLMGEPPEGQSKRERAGWTYTAWMLFALDA